MGRSSRRLMPSNAGLIFWRSDLIGIEGHGEAAKFMARGSNPL